MPDAKSTSNLNHLIKTYVRQPVVLYVGAGSSKGDKSCTRGIPGWWGLLELVLRKGAERVAEEDVAGLHQRADPWDAADFVLERMPPPSPHQRFQSALWEIVREPTHYPLERTPGSKKYKLISGEFLSQNATLNAITAFCGGIAAVVERQRPGGHYFVCRPNPRVRAVLTTNYDPFLEAASTSKYREALLKPVAAYGSAAGTMRQVPVFHVHGYIPHPHQAAAESDKKPFLKEMVMDRAAYERAWQRTDVFGPTMVPQIHYLRSYSVLFLGFSFSDKLVQGLLADIHGELRDRNRDHFALVSQSEFDGNVARDSGFYERMGIVPITYSNTGEIPGILGRLYRAGLQTDHVGAQIALPWVSPRSHRPSDRKPGILSGDGYWKALLEARLSHAPMPELQP